jgi:hypothetical protein
MDRTDFTGATRSLGVGRPLKSLRLICGRLSKGSESMALDWDRTEEVWGPIHWICVQRPETRWGRARLRTSKLQVDEMPKTDHQVAALKHDLEQFFAKQRLTTFAWLEGRDVTEEQAAKGGERTYFMMGFDSEVYRMFWPNSDDEPKDVLRNRSLRRTFDDIVAKHGFWTEFEEYYRICFMSLEPRNPRAKEKG